MAMATRGTTATPSAEVAHYPYLDEGLRVEVVTITPERAAQWLKRNHVNRTIKRQHVQKLVRALKRGQWEDVNGATIVFSDDHSLMDGQHRLQAVIEADTPITSLVVFGVKEAKRATIDTGAARSLADYLSMRQHPNAQNISATLALLWFWQNGLLLSYGRGNSPFVTYQEGLDFLQAHPTVADSVMRVKRLPRLMRPSHFALLDYVFREKDTPLAEVWYTTMATGILTPPYQAFLVLRERLIRDKTDHVMRHPFEHLVYSLRAWNSARRGETRSIFRWAETEGLPELR